MAAAASIFLGLGENATALAHLTEQGTPTITKYVNDARALAPGKTQPCPYARHAAAAGDVNVYLRKHRSKVFIRGLENPDQEGADLRAGNWNISHLSGQFLAPSPVLRQAPARRGCGLLRLRRGLSRRRELRGSLADTFPSLIFVIESQ